MDNFNVFDFMDNESKKLFIVDNKLTVAGGLYIICFYLALSQSIFNYIKECKKDL